MPAPSSDIVRRLAEIERRLAALEKVAHPPVDLEPFIRRCIAEELARRRC